MRFRLIADYTEIDELCCGAPFKEIPQATLDRIELNGGTVPTVDPFNRVVATDINPFSFIKDYGVSLEAEFDLGFATLTSLTGYRDYEDDENIDADFTDLGLIGFNPSQFLIEQVSQELRLTSNGDGPLDWTVGAFALDLNIFRDGGNIFWARHCTIFRRAQCTAARRGGQSQQPVRSGYRKRGHIRPYRL